MTEKEWSLTAVLKDVLKYPSLREPKPPTLWPSSATATRVGENGEEIVGGACRRATAISYLKRLRDFSPEKLSDFQHIVLKQIDEIPIERSVELERMGQLGNVFEDWIINDTKRSGMYYDDQCPVYLHEARLSGKIDICLWNAEAQKYVLVEVKSISPYWVDQCIGTKWMIDNNREAKPRTKHLLQIAFYHWHKALADRDKYDYSKLVYVGRAMGEAGEYNVDVRLDDEDGKHYIWYQQVEPTYGRWRNSGFTIESLVGSAKTILETSAAGKLPPRDFTWILSDEKINEMFENGELPAGQAEKHKKRMEQIKYNESVPSENAKLMAEYEEALQLYKQDSDNNPRPKKPKLLKEKRVNKRIERFNKTCAYCDYRTFCYDEEGNPLAG